MSDDERIKRRIYGRREAQSMLDLTNVPGIHPVSQEAFWEHLRDEALKHVPAPKVESPGVVPMNDTEAARFERECIPYGKHEGSHVETIMVHDPQYLDWLAGQADEFRQDLNRYLLSDRAKRHPSRRATQ